MLFMRSTCSRILLLAAAVPALQGARAGSAQSVSDKPPVEGSTVGYIDDAVVGSQVRVRFDAVFGDEQLDLAEFFLRSAVATVVRRPAQSPAWHRI